MKKRIAIIGAGPVGIVLAIKLHSFGFWVTVFEDRTKEQTIIGNTERSVNITLSKRGMDVLLTIGCAKAVTEISAKVTGRNYVINNTSHFLPYTSRPDRFLYSIERRHLESILIQEAESRGIDIRFGHRLAGIDSLTRECRFSSGQQPFQFDFMFGTDGAHSKVRTLLHGECTISTTRFVYKRIDIDRDNAHRLHLPEYAVNIFPGEYGMLLSLPNPDGTHSGLLHIESEVLDEIYNNPAVLAEYFPHLTEHIDDFEEKFSATSEGVFGSVSCTKWFWRNSILLLGDAAHAIVPFYGQGTNSGLEDVRILCDYITQKGFGLQEAARTFQETRPKSTTAISDLSLTNLSNLEAHDFSQVFVFKRVNLALEEKFADYHSEYSLIAFSDLPYHEARKQAERNAAIISEYLRREACESELIFSDELLNEIYQKIKNGQ